MPRTLRVPFFRILILAVIVSGLTHGAATNALAQPCSPGCSSDTGEVPCDPCTFGHYQPSTGQTTCLDCNPGSFIAIERRDQLQLVRGRSIPGSGGANELHRLPARQRDRVDGLHGLRRVHARSLPRLVRLLGLPELRARHGHRLDRIRLLLAMRAWNLPGCDGTNDLQRLHGRLLQRQPRSDRL